MSEFQRPDQTGGLERKEAENTAAGSLWAGAAAKWQHGAPHPQSTSSEWNGEFSPDP
jgi:hypothetical protein